MDTNQLRALSELMIDGDILVPHYWIDLVRDAANEIERLRLLNDRTYCAFCGEEFLNDDAAASRIAEHIKTCEKHPMRAVEDLCSANEVALDASNKHIVQLEREIMELRGTLP